MQEPFCRAMSFESKQKARRMARSPKERKHAMDSSIRRLIGSEANRSYLRALPAFKVEKKLPAKIAALLDRLDRTEDQRPQEQR
jgi:hypothetical protein